jgi:hypothetical protein
MTSNSVIVVLAAAGKGEGQAADQSDDNASGHTIRRDVGAR